MELCYELKKTETELESLLKPGELARWTAFLGWHHPDRRNDQRAGIIAAMLFNRGRSKSEKARWWKDFFPDRPRPEESKMSRSEWLKEMERRARISTVAHGGKIAKPAKKKK